MNQIDSGATARMEQLRSVEDSLTRLLSLQNVSASRAELATLRAETQALRTNLNDNLAVFRRDGTSLDGVGAWEAWNSRTADLASSLFDRSDRIQADIAGGFAATFRVRGNTADATVAGGLRQELVALSGNPRTHADQSFSHRLQQLDMRLSASDGQPDSGTAPGRAAPVAGQVTDRRFTMNGRTFAVDQQGNVRPVGVATENGRTGFPYTDLLVPVAGGTPQQRQVLQSVDIAIGDGLTFNENAGKAWRDRPDQAQQALVELVAGTDMTGRFEQTQVNYAVRWTELVEARNDAVRALASGNPGALQDAQARINRSLLGLNNEAATLNQIYGDATAVGRGLRQELGFRSLEVGRSLLSTGGAILTFIGTAPSALTFPPAPFLAAGAAGGTIQVGTREPAVWLGQTLFGIDPEAYRAMQPSLLSDAFTGTLGGAAAPVRFGTLPGNIAFQVGTGSLINTGGTLIDQGRLPTAAEFGTDALINTGFSLIDVPQANAARNLDSLAARMQRELPANGSARVGNVEFSRTPEGVRLTFDSGDQVLRRPDGTFATIRQVTPTPEAPTAAPDGAPPGQPPRTNRPAPPPADDGGAGSGATPPTGGTPPNGGTPPDPVNPQRALPAGDPTRPNPSQVEVLGPSPDGYQPGASNAPAGIRAQGIEYAPVRMVERGVGQEPIFLDANGNQMPITPADASPLTPHIRANSPREQPTRGYTLIEPVANPRGELTGVNTVRFGSDGTPIRESWPLSTNAATNLLGLGRRPDFAVEEGGRVTLGFRDTSSPTGFRLAEFSGSSDVALARTFRTEAPLPVPAEGRTAAAAFLREFLGVDVRVGVSGRVRDPITQDNLARGSIMVGVDSLDLLFRNRDVIADAVARGDTDQLNRTLTEAMGVGWRFNEAFLDTQLTRYTAGVGLGSNSAIQFKTQTLVRNALESQAGVGGTAFVFEPMPLRPGDPAGGHSDRASGITTGDFVTGRVRLNATEVTLAPGEVDVFGNRFAGNRYYRLEVDLPLDKLMSEVYATIPDQVPLIGGLGLERRAETTTKYTIPAGSILPAELVDNINQRVGGLGLTLRVAPGSEEAVRQAMPQFYGLQGPSVPPTAVDSALFRVDIANNGVARASSVPGNVLFSPDDPFGGLSNMVGTVDVNFFEGDPLRAAMQMGARLVGQQNPLPNNNVRGVNNLFNAITDPEAHSNSNKLRITIRGPAVVDVGAAAVNPTVQVITEGQQRSRTGPMGMQLDPNLNDPVAGGRSAVITRERVAGDTTVTSTFEAPDWFARTLPREINSIPVGGTAVIRETLADRRAYLTPDRQRALDDFVATELPRLRDQQPLSAEQRGRLLDIFELTMPPPTSGYGVQFVEGAVGQPSRLLDRDGNRIDRDEPPGRPRLPGSP